MFASAFAPFGPPGVHRPPRGNFRGVRPGLEPLIADASGKVVYDPTGQRTGSTLDARERQACLPVLARGAGYDLDALGITVCNIGGTNFTPYVKLLGEQGTDNPDLRAPRFNIHVNNLKLLSSDMLFTAINQLVQLSGLRYGYEKNNRVPLERTFRDLRSASLMYANDRLLVANGKLALLDRG